MSKCWYLIGGSRSGDFKPFGIKQKLLTLPQCFTKKKKNPFSLSPEIQLQKNSFIKKKKKLQLCFLYWVVDGGTESSSAINVFKKNFSIWCVIIDGCSHESQFWQLPIKRKEKKRNLTSFPNMPRHRVLYMEFTFSSSLTGAKR